MSLQIHVKISNVNSCLVEISPKTTVYDVKKDIATKSGLQLGTFDLIFCGKVLQNEAGIEELCLGQGSVLHVYSGRNTPTPAVDVKSHTQGSQQYQYFVYCKCCGDLKQGKLRVRCSTCREGAIILNKEPESWDDVLTKDQLDGQCTNCDSTRYAQFYFKCSSHDGQDEALPLQRIQPNFRQRECIICTNDSSPVLIYPCESKHVICVDCFQQYASTSLDSRTFTHHPQIGYSLPCPAGCEDSLIKDTHHFYLLGKDQYERYKDFGAEEYLLQTGGMLCPQPGCGEGLMVDPEARSITCYSCHFEFCRRCRMEVHNGECQTLTHQVPQLQVVDSEQALRSQWDFQSLETIQLTTKPCPHCNTRTEKNGGCMHILCSRCKKDWCWVCETEWNRTCQGDHWFG